MYACNYDYSSANEESANFGIAWTVYNSSSTCQYSSNVCNSFMFQIPEGLMHTGSYAVYDDDGYAYEFNMTDKTALLNDIAILQGLNWIDRNTRSIFIEFTTFNPNINLFSYNSILFEFLSTGNIIKSAKFNPLPVYSKDNSIFMLIINIIYISYISINIIVSLILMIKAGFKTYFSKLVNFIEWIVYAFSITSFALFLRKLYETNSLLDKLHSSLTANATGNSYLINLQMVNYWNDLLNMTLGITIIFSMLKLLSFMKFNKLNGFMQVLRLSFKPLANFSALFIIVFLSFSQFFYLTFMTRFNRFSTLLESIQSIFLMTLKSSTSDYSQNDTSTILLFILFNFITILMLYYLVSSILTNSFAKLNKIKRGLDEDDGEIDLHLMLLQLKYYLYKLLGLDTEKFYFYFSNDYKDIYITFKLKTLKLVDKLTVLVDEFYQLDHIRKLSLHRT